MPESAIPVVAAVIAAFTFFIAMVGGAALWTSRPRDGRQQTNAREAGGTQYGH